MVTSGATAPGAGGIVVAAGSGPRVVSVCLDLSPSHGGMYRAVTDVAGMLRSPIVSFRDGSGPLPCGALEVPVAVIDCTKVSLLRRAAWPTRHMRGALAAALAEADLVVVHSLFRAHAMLVERLARRSGTPFVLVPHGALTPTLWKSRTAVRRAWMAAGGGRVVRAAACVVFATQAERAGAVEVLGWEPRNEVIPFALPIPGERRPADRDLARRELGLPRDPRLIVVLGRFDAVKRLGEIVRGFLAADPAGCQLVIAGPEGDVTESDLRRTVPGGRSERVHFLGPLEPRRRDLLLAAADVYLSWSRHESFGYAAAEAMAAGLPVILPSGHALRSELGGVECGLLPEGDDLPTLGRALAACAAWSPAQLESLGAAGRQWVRARLAASSVSARWQSLIARLTCGR